MKVSLDISGLNDLRESFSLIASKDAAFASIATATELAFGVRTVWKQAVVEVFDRPTRFTQNAMLVEKATLSNGGSRVFVRDQAAGGTPPSKYLQAQALGGSRAMKGVGRALQRMGAMPAGMFAVAGKGARLDAYGNVARAQIRQLLGYLDAAQNAGGTAKKKSRTAARYFSAMPGTRTGAGSWQSGRMQHLTPGIYSSTKNASGYHEIKPVLIFVDGVRYTDRFDVFDRGEKYVAANVQRVFGLQFDKATASTLARAKRKAGV